MVQGFELLLLCAGVSGTDLLLDVVRDGGQLFDATPLLLQQLAQTLTNNQQCKSLQLGQLLL